MDLDFSQETTRLQMVGAGRTDFLFKFKKIMVKRC
jgi:hypothetical protein